MSLLAGHGSSLNSAQSASSGNDGLVFICSVCEYYMHRKHGNSCNITECGGPLSGKLFPMYKGELLPILYKICYICGKDAIIAIGDGHRALGICEDHKQFIQRHLRVAFEFK